MTRNEQVIRALYQAAEVQDSKKLASLFTGDGVFNDVSAGVKYRGKDLDIEVAVSRSLAGHGSATFCYVFVRRNPPMKYTIRHITRIKPIPPPPMAGPPK